MLSADSTYGSCPLPLPGPQLANRIIRIEKCSGIRYS